MTAGLACTTAVTSGAAATTVVDDLPEPYAALSLICVTAIAITAVRRLVSRLEIAERDLAAEREHRARAEEEYEGLVEDYNELVIEQAAQSGVLVDRPADDLGHGPRCQCGRRGPHPYLSLVEPPRQGSA